MNKAPAITRKNFNDTDKAKIFARDRATCCFSGANLWLLDAPLRVGWQSDWADHKKPISRGGKADWEENGVCASHTLNMKKRNNTADTTYLFERGHPTALYYELFGTPPPHVSQRLQRLSNHREVDWYFNRAISWIFEAFNFIWSQPKYERTDEDWFKAAYRKLREFQKFQESAPAVEERGIIQSPSETQEIFLFIRTCDSLKAMTEQVIQLSNRYSQNSSAWWNYFHPCYDDASATSRAKDLKRHRAYEKACKIRERLDTETFQCIQDDFQFRFSSK